MRRKTPRPETDFRDEIDAHIQLEADQLIEEGMDPKRAHDAARRQFGNVTRTQERCYESSRWLWLDQLRRDTRYALRQLRHSPVASLMIVLSIAVGVGLNVAIFSLADQALVRSLPVHAPERLVQLEWDGEFIVDGMGSVGPGRLIPFPLFDELSEVERSRPVEDRIFEGLFARAPAEVHLGVRGASEAAVAELVTGSYFDTLGVVPALGRLLAEQDDQVPGGHPLVVLSHDYWQTRFAGDPEVVGRALRVNDLPMTVIGVAQPGFFGTDWSLAPAVWLPMTMKESLTGWSGMEERRTRFSQVFGRLGEGTSAQQAELRLGPWFAGYLQADTEDASWPAVTESQLDAHLGTRLAVRRGAQGQAAIQPMIRQPMMILALATALVLLLACLNVANLSLARALASRRGTALRIAFGASGRRVVTEQLVESGLLAVAGAFAGVMAAPVLCRTLLLFLEDLDVGSGLSSALDLRVLSFALVVAVLTTLVAGTAPAVFASSTRPIEALRQRVAGESTGLGLRRLLVVGQFALAMILLVSAGLFARTLGELNSRGPGFDTEGLVMFRVAPQLDGHGEDPKALFRRLLTELRALPEAEGAGLSWWELLGGGGWNNPVTVSTSHRIPVEQSLAMNAVSPGFFETLGAAIVLGRNFDEGDLRAESGWGLRSVIVNQEFVRRYLAEESPLEAQLAFGVRADADPSIQIVGVVSNFQDFGLREAEPQVFFPFWEISTDSASFYVRSQVETGAAMDAIRAAVDRVGAGLTVLELRTVERQVDRRLASERMLATLASGFAVVATFLAMIGLYGVLSFSARRRNREMGIRLALGSPRWSAGGLILREAGALALTGLVIALPGTWALGRVIASQLYGVEPMDSRTIFLAGLALVSACLVAGWVPARSVAKTDPLQALRRE